MKLVILICVISVLLMVFKCPASDCPKSYNTEQGYHRHLNTCKLYQKRLSKKPKPVQPHNVVQPELMALDELVPVADSLSSERAGSKLRHRQIVPAKFTDLTTGTSATPPPAPQAPALPVPMAAGATSVKGKARQTPRNKFGIFHVWREYPHASPPRLGEGIVSDIPTFTKPPESADQEEGSQWWAGFGALREGVSRQALNCLCAPFANSTIFRLVRYYYTTFQDSSVKSFNNFVNLVLKAKDFRIADIPDKFDLRTELKKLDNLDASNSPLEYSGVWHEVPVFIPLPAEGKNVPEAQAPTLQVNVQHRKLVEIIRSAFQGHDALSYHYTPVKTFWQPTPESKPERVYGEVYESNAFWDEHEAIMLSLTPEQVTTPIAVAALMLYSDSTHVAQFGSAAMWPGYVYMGNQSKYDRGKPSSYAAHHAIYMPTLPKEFQDLYQDAHPDQPASAPMITHLKRELIQAVWKLMLDDEFKDAYKDGLVIKCADGIMRRIYPRIFCYSADYPEKQVSSLLVFISPLMSNRVMLSSIRFLARRGCPEDLVEKQYFDELGTTNDLKRREHVRIDDEAYHRRIEKARWWIFNKGRGPAATNVDKLLGDKSEAPVRNAFSALLPVGRVYQLFVPDLLHEFELGVWKAVFTHIMRILQACTQNQVQELNKRFRAVPTFGRDTIRKFSENASSMKKMAARDFEDLLQCSMPVFECLLPETPHNTVIMDLLFVLACWHASAKLRLHTERTVRSLGLLTRAVGMTARRFRAKVCRSFSTLDLPGEDAARGRREKRTAQNKAAKGKNAAKNNKAAKAKKSATTGKGKQKAAALTAEGAAQPGGAKKRRVFNLNTYKFHALGHYVKAILRIGTSDSYSTQHGEQEHRRVKRFYVHTNKRRAFGRQVARHYRRQRLLLALQHKFNLATIQQGQESADNGPTVLPHMPDPLPKASPNRRYQVSKTDVYALALQPWLDSHKDGLACNNFFDDLRAYILARLTSLEHYSSAEYTPDQLNRIIFKNKAIYRHKVLRINYTTYDMQRMQDSINPNTSHRDVMLLAHESDNEPGFHPHPYWYARVIGVFHVDVVLLCDNNRQEIEKEVRVDFLWVRWFARVKGTRGLEEGRLPRCAFIDSELEQSGAFGFVDPADVIRAVHMLPVFCEPRTNEFLPGKSIARQKSENDADYAFYDVNIFADRDMFMRFTGGGPGHGVPLPYYPLQLEKFYAIKKGVPGPSRGQDNGNESAEDIGRTQEEEDGLNDNEFEEYGYLQGLPSDNEEDMPEEAGGDLEENLGVEPDEDSGDDMDEAREVSDLGFGSLN